MFAIFWHTLKNIAVLKYKGNRAFADLRYGEEDSISPRTLIVAATKGLLGIYTLHIPPKVLKKLALR